MNRFKDQSDGNENLPESMDTGFVGVNTLLDPGLLKTGAAWSDVNAAMIGPGVCSHAVNMRFRRGMAETRLGSVAPTWCNPRNPLAATMDAATAGLFQAGNEVGTETRHADNTMVKMTVGTSVTWLRRLADDQNGKPQYYLSDDPDSAQVYWDTTRWVFSDLAGTTKYGTGAVAFPWLATWPAGTTAEAVGWIEPWSSPVLAATVFSDPDGFEWLALAFADKVALCREGQWPKVLGLPDGVSLAEPCKLIQTFDSMVVLRGFDAAPLAWDGASDAFEEIPEADPSGSFTASIPPAETGAVMGNRLLLVMDRDTVAVSDVFDFTRYDDALNAFRINSGEDDRIVQIQPFRKVNLLVFKSQSIHVIGDVKGDLSGVFADVLNSSIGCAARDSVATVGGDVFFLSEGGVFRISEVLQDSLQVGEKPVSEAITTLIDRINWDAVDKCAAVVHGDYYRLAVPLDGSESCNAVLVYDTVRGAWQGYDSYGYAIEGFARTNYLGRKCAFGICKAAGVVMALDQGANDAMPGATALAGLPSGEVFPFSIKDGEVMSEVRTRGYLLTEDNPKRFRHGFVTLETWNPTITVTVHSDGVNESETVRSITRDRRKYFTFGKIDFNTTNVNNDFLASKREDYSVVIPSGGLVLHGTGIPLHQMQFTQEHFAIRRHAAWVAIGLTCTTGRMAVKSAGVDGSPRRNVGRTMA